MDDQWSVTFVDIVVEALPQVIPITHLRDDKNIINIE
jgi:hypothetical protein